MNLELHLHDITEFIQQTANAWLDERVDKGKLLWKQKIVKIWNISLSIPTVESDWKNKKKKVTAEASYLIVILTFLVAFL